jgi:hypothetical protein
MITAEDNLGIASAQFHYSQEGEDYQSVEMIPIDGDTFYAQVNWSDMEVLEHFYYYFSAQDNSSNQNQTITEEYSFQVLTNVVFDNFENGLDNWLADNGWRLQSLRYFSPVTALNDRNEFGQPASQQEIITLAQPWLPNGLSNLILEFWTLYFFIPQNDTGFVEVNVDDSWVTLDTITGLIGEWEKRSINLEDFINLDSIYVRFHTHANDSFTATTLGWYIDDITLRTDPLVEIGADTQVNLDLGFRLKDISPNPGNGEFNISFYLPNEGKAKLSLFNLLGEKLITIKEENFTAGLNQVKWRANFPSGVYFVEIRFGTDSRIGNILLLK